MELSRGGDVVVTAVGMVTGGGIGVGEAWDALRAGRVNPAAIELFAAGRLAGAVGIEVRDWKAERFWKDRRVAYYTRAAQFALKAAEECLAAVAPAERQDLGVLVGSRYSTLNNGFQFLEDPDFLAPIQFLSALPSSTPTNISLSLGLHGITTSVSSSAAGLEALGCARDLLAAGDVQALLAGGAEELTPEVYAGCLVTGAVAGAAGEGGLVPGEASAMLLLETPPHAAAGGRTPLATIAGYGSAFTPVAGTADAVMAASDALQAALADAGMVAADIDAVFLGANGHGEQDEVSRAAMAAVFGQRLPVLVAPKAWTGETFGAAGAIAAAAAVLSLRDGVLPGGLAAADCRTILVHDYGCDGGHAGLILSRPANNSVT